MTKVILKDVFNVGFKRITFAKYELQFQGRRGGSIYEVVIKLDLWNISYLMKKIGRALKKDLTSFVSTMRDAKNALTLLGDPDPNYEEDDE